MLYSVLAVSLVGLARLLKLSRSSRPDVPKKSVPVALLMLLFSGAAYVVYYLVTGWITYTYFTRDYYPPDATDKVLELGLWFWVIQLARGTLMALRRYLLGEAMPLCGASVLSMIHDLAWLDC